MYTAFDSECSIQASEVDTEATFEPATETTSNLRVIMKPGNKGFKRIVNATKFSWKGLKASFKHEEAFRQELMLLVIGAPLALWLGDTGLEKAVMIGSLMLLLIVEVLNSAIEAVVDRTGDEWHKLSGRAKDMGSAAVFLAIINAIVIWALILVF